ncbi:ABC transporter substrate-binding protein [Palleronia sp. LCG004]|uniref:ABC transporter substrate-binding protein n=1 Tax=Palleronia sp. LCG004 TaxID=3079304 RepID=UPI002941F1F9|nr:ABC transporter substrate-binding protein [Palleronia sp. LCG004]WOI55422.1 ABC transporter substrate-binding protein [Palleronia sp. LCG004]
MKTILTSLALGAALTGGPALADLTFPSLSYRTGPYAANGMQFADGYADYFALINARDGGIGGEMINMPECETAYNTEQGVECYESTKNAGDGALIYQPLSTGITYQLIPKLAADGIPMHTLGYGRTSVSDGDVFKWIFNYPATYWDGASVAIKYLLEENGGDLSGKKIALLYHNSAYGKEPIRTLTELSGMHGFEFSQIAVDHPGQEQKSQWLQIRRDRPDYVIMWGWGVMNQVAIQEAANIRYPMDQIIGSWWAGSEVDVLPAGDGADGYKALNFHAVGDDFELYDALEEYVWSQGLGAGGGEYAGSVIYNRGIYAAMIAVEAARKAQEIHGVSAIDAAQMRDGLEQLEMTEEKMAELGLAGFGPTFSASCRNHGGSGRVAINQWNAGDQTWSVLTDYIQSDQELIARLVEEDSTAYAQENGIPPQCE